MAVASIFFVLLLSVGSVPGYARAASAVVDHRILHFVAYGFLSALIYSCLGGAPARRARCTLLAIAVLGGLDESLQSFLPYRNGDFSDWGCDMLAVLSCVAVLAFFQARSAGRKVAQSRTLMLAPDHQEEPGYIQPAEGKCQHAAS
ncbi:VanZ family protein [Collimonas silvisoli]|uniref:VanZ family protein n=1 Tax=Collimonas silvisoli TaxID=2825884 RepID=UPI001B8CF4E3|nr:VanZ family protein [Collimonas silvisoli]